jgi:hypothetical protein
MTLHAPARTGLLVFSTQPVTIESRWVNGNYDLLPMTLQAMSGNRFVCGVGPSGPQVVQGWRGPSYPRGPACAPAPA